MQTSAEGKVIPLRVDGDLVARIEAAKRRRGSAQPKDAQVMRELLRNALAAEEKAASRK